MSESRNIAHVVMEERRRNFGSWNQNVLEGGVGSIILRNEQTLVVYLRAQHVLLVMFNFRARNRLRICDTRYRI